MNLYLGPYSFGPFAVVLLTCFIYVYALLPETKGRTAEEVSVELERMLGNRNIGRSSTSSNQGNDDPLAIGSVAP
jgi:Sugar (and other) transporter